MNMRTLISTFTLVASLAFAAGASAQCDTIASLCEKNITAEYIPDGQFYRALLHDDEQAEFNLTLFGGTTYRVAACSGTSDGNLIFSVFAGFAAISVVLVLLIRPRPASVTGA